MLSRLLTTGMTAATRVSTAAVNQAVQPRLEAPLTMNLLMYLPPPPLLPTKATVAFMHATTALTIGNCTGQFESPV